MESRHVDYTSASMELRQNIRQTLENKFYGTHFFVFFQGFMTPRMIFRNKKFGPSVFLCVLLLKQ